MSENLTPAALRAMLAEATPGPWKLYGNCIHGGERERKVAKVQNSDRAIAFADATLIAAAPTAIRLLLDVAEALEPFAAACEAMENCGNADWWIDAWEMKVAAARITMSDLRAARAALAALEETPDE